MNKAIKSASAFMKNELLRIGRPEEWHHIERILDHVRAVQIFSGEGDGLVVELGVILYDALDARFFFSGETSERRMIIADFIRGLGLTIEQFRKLYMIIEHAESRKNSWKPEDHAYFPELRIIEEAREIMVPETVAY